MKRTMGLLTAALLATTGAGAARGQTLEEALATAYLSHPTLLAARAQLRAVDENVPVALSGWRPTVSLGGQAGKTRVETAGTSGTISPRSASLSASQPLFSGGRTIAAVDQAERTVLAQRAALQGTEQAVLFDAIVAYMNVVRDQAVLELNINNVQVLRRQLDATRDRFRVGEITLTDVAQAEARLARSIADRVQAEGNLKTSRAAFENAVGIPAGSVKPIDPPKVGVTALEQAVAAAISQNPAVLSAEQNALAAVHGVDLVRGELLPSIALTGDLGRSENASLAGGRTETASAAIEVSVPLYQSGATYGRLRQQKHVAGQRRIQVDETRRDAIESASQSWENLVTSQARTESFAAQIKAAQIALEGVQREAQVGSRTVLDVLDAEQELMDARVSLVRAQRDEVVTAFQLKASMGQLTAQTLGLPVPVFDPTVHYREVRGKWFGGDIGPDESTAQKK
ncbi:MAG: TolC family outer membrane protein [Alphaproteobacteria bacterium]|nr:TolC family outer membrane protein [Alphaproteobacteria bacterium]